MIATLEDFEKRKMSYFVFILRMTCFLHLPCFIPIIEFERCRGILFKRGVPESLARHFYDDVQKLLNSKVVPTLRNYAYGNMACYQTLLKKKCRNIKPAYPHPLHYIFTVNGIVMIILIIILQYLNIRHSYS